MKLRHRVVILLLGKPEDLLQIHRVAAFFAGLSSVGALTQLTVDYANVGVVDVAVNVVVSGTAVETHSYLLGKASQPQNIGTAVQRDAVLEAKSFSLLDLSCNLGVHLRFSHTKRKLYIS